MTEHAPNQPPEVPGVDDWHDRLMDRALREKLAGDTPPDLSERILAAHAERAPSPAAVGERRIHWRRGAAVVTAASLLIGAGVWASRHDKSDSRQATAHLAPGEFKSSRMLAERTIEKDAASTDKDFKNLFDLIQSTAEAETWEAEASGKEKPNTSNLRLEISQPQTVHEPEPIGQATVVVTDGLGWRAGSPGRVAVNDASVPEFTADLDAPFRQGSFGTPLVGDGNSASEDSAMPAAQPPRVFAFDGPASGGRTILLPAAPAAGRQAERVAKELAPGATEGRFGLAKEKLTELRRLKSGAVDAETAQRIAQYGMAYRFRDGENPDGVLYLNDGKSRRPLHVYWKHHAGRWAWFDPNGQPEGEGPGQGGDRYDRIHENPFLEPRGERALSTFSIDVDTASYANVRQFLNSGRLPPPDAVRIEELVNYFDYGYEGPAADDGAPFAANVEVAGCPWAPEHRLVRIGVKGREIETEKRPLTNLVFLVDVSGSMNNARKHPLVVEGLKALTKELGENDRVAIVVYASQEGLALESTPGDRHGVILSALDGLRAGGSTAGGAGIRLAYQIAEDNFIEGGANRVILCTDGDFNVGTTSTAELERLVAEKAKQTGVFLSVCGFGRGNLNDAMMETISGRGNGEYYYIDSRNEAERVFVRGLTGTLVTIAKDVKIQVEFNPATVAGYRLIGYENRVLAAQDFNDDKKDAGEIGAGHTVTALYEVVPAGEPVPAEAVDALKYQQPATVTGAASPVAPNASSGELLTLKMRYKQPDGDVSTKREWSVTDDGKGFAQASTDLQFAAGVAGFGMLLRGSRHAGDATLDAVLEIADSARGDDPEGYRAEFVELARKAKPLLAGRSRLKTEATVESGVSSRR